MKARMGLVVACLVASVASAQSKTESNASGVVLPPDAKVEGVSIGEWTGRWWRWALSQQIAPFLDPDGRLCQEGQEGPVWYLAGTSGNFNAQRECVVPTGKYLLVPIINMIHMDPDSQHPRRCADMQAEAAVNNDHLVSVVVLIDGEPLPDATHYRVRSDGCFVLTHDDQGPRHAAADGYWLMLKPLKPGRHVLTIGANYGADNKNDCYCNMVQNFEYVLYVGGRSILSLGPTWGGDRMPYADRGSRGQP